MRLLTLAITLAISLLGFNAFAAGKVHQVVFHVDQNNPKVMNLTLNNVQNMRNYYKKAGEEVIIEVVVNGPGIFMYDESSPVKARIETMSLEASNVKFSGCSISKQKIGKKTGKELKMLSEVQMIPSGVVRLVELQEDGFAYIRP